MGGDSKKRTRDFSSDSSSESTDDHRHRYKKEKKRKHDKKHKKDKKKKHKKEKKRDRKDPSPEEPAAADTTTAMAIGPERPPVSDSESEGPGPAMPGTANDAPARRGPIGPMRPPDSFLAVVKRHEETAVREDDGDFAPMAPGMETAEEEARRMAVLKQAEEREQTGWGDVREGPDGQSNKNQPKEREGWMVELPAERCVTDKFGVSRMFSKRGVQSRGDSSAWTDTPEEKARKALLEAEQMEAQAQGIVKKSADEDEMMSREAAKDYEVARMVEEYNEKHRSKTLIEDHKEILRIKQEKEGKPKATGVFRGPYDRETLMGGGKVMGEKEVGKLVSQAADLYSRFGPATTKRYN